MPRACLLCKENDAVMHRFPNYKKCPERFKIWVSLCGGKLETEADYEYYMDKRICDKHFTSKDHNRNNRLNAMAVPSLFLTAASAETQVLENQPIHAVTTESQVAAHLSIIEGPSGTESKTTESEPAEIPMLPKIGERPLPTSCLPNAGKSLHAETTVSMHLPKDHNYVVTADNKTGNKKQVTVKYAVRDRIINCAKTSYMRLQIKKLRSEIRKLKKNGEFRTRLANAQKLSESTLFKQVVKGMTKPAQIFVNMQLQTSKDPKGRRFSIEEKILALSLYKKSPKCYALLYKYFTLPSGKAMKRLLSQIKLIPGINPVIFEKIKKTIGEKDMKDRLCSLAFDEMSLTPQINYVDHKDTIEGFATNNEFRFADHVLVFMVKGVRQSFKQPIAYYFTNCLNKIELKKLIKTVIHHALNSGLIILNTVCDQSTVNVSAINEFIEETKRTHLRRGGEWRHDHFSVSGHNIIPLFDTPHLIKGIRNNLLTKDLIYISNNKQHIVKWEYYQKVYAADKSYGELKLLHKITEEHVNPDKINKMRVKNATQLFSRSVAVVTEHLTARGDLPEECRSIIDITLLLNNLFDSLNISSLTVPDGQEYKGPVKLHSPHHKLWVESKNILKTVKFIQNNITGNKARFIETDAPSVKNLIRTIEGMEAIWKILNQKYGFDALLTRNFNQDPVENFFGNIRSYGVRNIAPNTIAFEGAFKALLLNNYSTPHSQKANCEEDKNECLQSLDFYVKESLSVPDVNTENKNEDVVHLDEELLEGVQQEEDAGQRNYVCGWVLTKCLKNICKSCKQCRTTLLDSNNNDNNAYIKAKEYKNKNWLCYPSKDAENCFYEIQKQTNLFLKNNQPKKDVRKNIKTLCNIFINYPFKCSLHKEPLKEYFVDITIKIILYSWCKTVNRILAGKIIYSGEDRIKKSAAMYYNKHKHYKNRK